MGATNLYVLQSVFKKMWFKFFTFVHSGQYKIFANSCFDTYLQLQLQIRTQAMSLLLSNDVGGVISNAYHKNYFCHAEITYVLIYLSGKQNKNIDLSALYLQLILWRLNTSNKIFQFDLPRQTSHQSVSKNCNQISPEIGFQHFCSESIHPLPLYTK